MMYNKHRVAKKKKIKINMRTKRKTNVIKALHIFCVSH